MQLFRSKIDRLLDKAAELGRREVTMPIDIFSLARGFADLPDRAATFERTRAALLPHPNAFVRRVFFVMLRFMGEAGPRKEDLTEVVLAGLGDAGAWVPYDAAWLAGDRRISSPAIIAKLRELAAGYDPGVVSSLNEAQDSLTQRAAETLALFEED